MAVCRHCGAIIDDDLKICPDCGQKNTEQVDESYLDNLLNSLVSAEPVRPAKKEKKEKKAEETLTPDFFIPAQTDMESIPEKFEENPENVDSYNLFDRDSDIEEEEYSIFDELEGADLEALIAEELAEESVEESVEEPKDVQHTDDFFATLEDAEEQNEPEDFFILPDENEEPYPTVEEEALEDLFASAFEETNEVQTQAEDLGLGTEEFADLDDLFQGFDEADVEEMVFDDTASSEEAYTELGLEELLVSEENNEENAKKTKEKAGFWKRIFGNVPVDPSKIKPEPTPEEIAEVKKKKAEEKKKAKSEKKLASAEKKEAAKKRKEEKALQAELAKEEKKKRKMEEAEQLLEEMGETRINRVGATIVFVFFAVIAVVVIVGSNLFTYSVSVKNAKKNFELAYNNDVKYYTEAYNHIYGLEMRNEEDQELEDKIMTVMFVNKELNSYNSYMLLDDKESALHSLVKGLYRYGKYIEQAFVLEIDKDMDYVRTQILKELETTFDVSEDEAEVLRNLLYESLSDDEKAVEYSKEIYKIVEEAENLQ